MARTLCRPLILMYHGTPAHEPGSRYSLRRDLFRRHLDYLAVHGWRTVLVRELAGGLPDRDKVVAITFDDGYLDNFEGAYEPLRCHGMVATWFVTTDCIGGYARWMGEASAATRMLGREHLEEMAAHGMEIASHTCSHPDLSTLSPDRQRAEMTESRQVLEDIVRAPVQSFAYPYGRFSEASPGIAREAGYGVCCTARPGWLSGGDDPFLLRRVTVFSGDGARTLARKLAFADNDVSWQRLGRYYASRVRYRLAGLVGP